MFVSIPKLIFINPFSSIIDLNLLSSSFSNNLDMIGSMEIGLYDLAFFRGVPGLKNHIIYFRNFPDSV